MGSNQSEPPRQPRLNFDVLRLICNDLTDVSDVLSFALTCSTLRKGALQRRLGMSSVFLSSPDSVERFHKFIFADPASRAPYMYGLSIYPYSKYAPNGDPRFQNYLVAILEAATRLEYLHFPTNIGPSVCSAITKMTTLRELDIVSDAHSYDTHHPEALSGLLTELRSPLQYLGLAEYEREQIFASFLHYQLPHFALTLESLRLGDFPFNILPVAVTTPFTSMRSLHLCSAHQSEFYRLDVLLRLFPNLDDTLFLKGFFPPLDQYPVLRERSKEAQRDYTWPGLFHVTYSVDSAFLLALRCPIRCMEIDGLVLHDTRYLTEALQDNCPRQLSLPISFFGHDHLPHLDGLFPSEATNKLTHLVLFAEIHVNRQRPTGECRNFSWVQFIECLVNSIKHIRLTHLRIVLYYHWHAPVIESTSGSTKRSWAYMNVSASLDSEGEREVDPGIAQNVMHDIDLHPAATGLLDALPTLEYLSLASCGIRRFGKPQWKYWHSSKAWHVVTGAADESGLGDSHRGPSDASARTQDTRSCLEISDEAAEDVIYKEELHLGERAENMVRECITSASQ